MVRAAALAVEAPAEIEFLEIAQTAAGGGNYSSAPGAAAVSAGASCDFGEFRAEGFRISDVSGHFQPPNTTAPDGSGADHRTRFIVGVTFSSIVGIALCASVLIARRDHARRAAWLAARALAAATFVLLWLLHLPLRVAEHCVSKGMCARCGCGGLLS